MNLVPALPTLWVKEVRELNRVYDVTIGGTKVIDTDDT
jgi:hypothetical protein